jgi:hypothetical protein
MAKEKRWQTVLLAASIFALGILLYPAFRSMGPPIEPRLGG